MKSLALLLGLGAVGLTGLVLAKSRQAKTQIDGVPNTPAGNVIRRLLSAMPPNMGKGFMKDSGTDSAGISWITATFPDAAPDSIAVAVAATASKNFQAPLDDQSTPGAAYVQSKSTGERQELLVIPGSEATGDQIRKLWGLATKGF